MTTRLPRYLRCYKLRLIITTKTHGTMILTKDYNMFRQGSLLPRRYMEQWSLMMLNDKVATHILCILAKKKRYGPLHVNSKGTTQSLMVSNSEGNFK
jgi:hypothetical protein